MRGFKRLIIIFGLAVAIFTTKALASEPEVLIEAKQKPEIISQIVKTPPKFRIIRIHNWTPWAHPSIAQVKQIATLAQKRWGGPSLHARINCESGFRWYADNGTYEGVLQFGPIWNSMYPGTPRKVKFVKIKTVRLKEIQTTKYSDGKIKRKIIRRFRGKRKVIKTGKLPKPQNLKYENGGAKHAWAAIRVGQRAVAGKGPTTGWGCDLVGVARY